MSRQREIPNTDEPVVEKKRRNVKKDTVELAAEVLKLYAQIQTDIGDMHDLMSNEQSTGAMFKLYASVIDAMQVYEKLVGNIRNKTFKQVFEESIVRFQRELKEIVQSTVNEIAT